MAQAPSPGAATATGARRSDETKPETTARHWETRTHLERWVERVTIISLGLIATLISTLDHVICTLIRPPAPPPSLVNLTFVCPGNTRMLACVNTRKDPTRGDGCPRLGGRGTGGRKGRARGRVWGKGRGRGKEEGLEKEEGKWESEGEGKRKGEREHNERRVKRDI